MALFSIESYGELEPHIRQEWLVTNGIGGYAASTVVGCNTRRYHGLLCAATLPPVGRMMAVNRIGESMLLDGKADALLELGINQFVQGRTYHPRGDRYLRQFHLDDGFVRWEFEVNGVAVVKELQMAWQQNAAIVRYTLKADRPDRRMQFSAAPFVSLRDFHAERHAGEVSFKTTHTPRGAAVSDGAHTVSVFSDAGAFTEAPDWWYGHFYAIEAERGQDDNEDLFTPGRFTVEAMGSAVLTLYLTLAPAVDPDPVPSFDWDAALQKRRAAVAAATELPANLRPRDGRASLVGESASLTLRRLAHAANDFIVQRKAPDGSPGMTVIAGYPWFADWGRDTMISLPGLFLATGRFAQARGVLGVFAAYVSEGMIPNRFDDYSNEPHYNTVDASLWFIHACYEYLRLSRDQKTFEATLLPACRAIVRGYRDGTRFHIKMDPADGLISQGDANTQLTWMDAKCNGVAFTPRQGKPVEINALWYHALVLTGETELAARVSESFRKAFWISPFRGLCDVIDGLRRDSAIRPNQIFAVSLPNSPLSRDQQHAVVEVVRRELLTPVGLRTLARSDPGFRGQYRGTQFERDGAYHNGTIWPWLLGPFLSAYLNVHRRSPESLDQAKRWLGPLLEQMHTAGIGQIAEICEADEPHRTVGCPAQAWSVAEVLRLAAELSM